MRGFGPTRLRDDRIVRIALRLHQPRLMLFGLLGCCMSIVGPLRGARPQLGRPSARSITVSQRCSCAFAASSAILIVQERHKHEFSRSSHLEASARCSSNIKSEADLKLICSDTAAAVHGQDGRQGGRQGARHALTWRSRGRRGRHGRRPGVLHAFRAVWVWRQAEMLPWPRIHWPSVCSLRDPQRRHAR